MQQFLYKNLELQNYFLPLCSIPIGTMQNTNTKLNDYALKLRDQETYLRF